jgi:hypothetical protein
VGVGIFIILLSAVAVRGGVFRGLICGYVGDLCTVTWRGEKYRVECTPSFLLSLASALAPEGVSHIEIYRQLVSQVRKRKKTAEVVGELLREKF